MKAPRRRTASGARGAATAGAARLDADAATATALKLFVTLARAFESVSEHARRNVERHGLSHTEFAILEALYHKGPLLLGDVQRKILVSSGGVTFLVDRLAARGLVERQACPSDRRARYAVLTRRGHALMARIFPGHAEVIRDAMAGLSRADQRAATSLLRTLGLRAAAVSGA